MFFKSLNAAIRVTKIRVIEKQHSVCALLYSRENF